MAVAETRMYPSTGRNREHGESVAVAQDTRLAALVRGLWPFWLFKDATRGDVYARAAARQHNLRMRERLPRYLLKWFAICCVASAAIYACDAMAADVGRRLDVFVLMAAGSGIVCAYGVCVLFVIGYAYLRLLQLDR